MNTDYKKNEHDAPSASFKAEQLPANEKKTLPGRQIGLYSKADRKEVRQVVEILNPDNSSLGSRG